MRAGRKSQAIAYRAGFRRRPEGRFDADSELLCEVLQRGPGLF